MSKKTLLKGIIAVSAATTMLFSTAFAAEISSTRTLYVKGSTNTVEVATTVTGLAVGDEVTYLAGDASNPVYINQYTAGNTTETFTYKTTRVSDLATTSVKMAKADSSFANGQAIAADATIPNPEMFAFNVTIDGTPADAIEVNPNAVGTTVSVPFTLAADKKIDTVKVNDADATYVLGENTITITHGVEVAVADNNTFTPGSAAIVITTKEKADPVEPEVPTYAGGFKAKEYTWTDGNTTVTGPMYAIYATSEKLTDDNCVEFGIALSNINDNIDGNWVKYPSTAPKGEKFGIAIIEADPKNIPNVVYARTYYTVKVSENVTNTSFSNEIITINLK